MRRLQIFLMALMLLLFTSFMPAQTMQIVLACDSMANSATLTGLLGGFIDRDSLTFSVYASGEIDIDTLGIQFFEKTQAKYKGADTTIYRLQTKDATYSTVMTINLADGVTIYTADVVTIPKSAWKGYNGIKAYLKAAASGNDTSDGKQKAVLIVTLW